MPIEERVLDNGAGILYSFTGLVTGREIIDMTASLYASEERMKKIRYAIVDETRLVSLDMTFDDLKAVEERDKLAAQVAPCAVVAIIAEKDLPYHIAQAWNIRTPGITWEKQVFRSKDEAYAWLREKVREKFGEEMTGMTFESQPGTG